MPCDAAGGSPWQELIQSSHEELGHKLALNGHECSHACFPLTYQTSQAAALVRTEVLYFYTRGSSHAAGLPKAEVPFYYSGQSVLSGLQGSDSRIKCLSLFSIPPRDMRGSFACVDRFVPGFPWGVVHSMLWKPRATGIPVGVNYICQN